MPPTSAAAAAAAVAVAATGNHEVEPAQRDMQTDTSSFSTNAFSSWWPVEAGYHCFGADRQTDVQKNVYYRHKSHAGELTDELPVSTAMRLCPLDTGLGKGGWGGGHATTHACTYRERGGLFSIFNAFW